jgi:hypothetical protein
LPHVTEAAVGQGTIFPQYLSKPRRSDQIAILRSLACLSVSFMVCDLLPVNGDVTSGFLLVRLTPNPTPSFMSLTDLLVIPNNKLHG